LDRIEISVFEQEIQNFLGVCEKRQIYDAESAEKQQHPGCYRSESGEESQKNAEKLLDRFAARNAERFQKRLTTLLTIRP
jgi:DNA anti-recombination protein RmuC